MEKKKPKICNNCNQEKLMRKKQKFCSYACSNIYYKTKPETHLYGICPECEKEFKYSQAQNHRVFCSTKCKYSNMSKDPKIAERFSVLTSNRLIDNQDKIDVESWRAHLVYAETANNTTFSPEVRLEFFKHFVFYGNFDNAFPDYRLKKTSHRIYPERDPSALRISGKRLCRFGRTTASAQTGP